MDLFVTTAKSLKFLNSKIKLKEPFGWELKRLRELRKEVMIKKLMLNKMIYISKM